MDGKSRTLNRRDFIRQAACASLGATALINTMSYLKLTSAAMAQSSNDSGDYKALVCIFLSGGNDSNNMLLPSGVAVPNSLRANYEAGRAQLALSTGLNELTLPASTSAFNQYHGGVIPSMATHPNTPELAQLFNEGDLGFVCNVGTLAYPIPTREDYIEERVQLPPDLFSHSDQQMQWQTSVADRPEISGWGGRTADLLHAAYNADTSKCSMSISLSGINTYQRSLNSETAAFVMGSTGVNPLLGFASGGMPYGNAYNDGSTFAAPDYKTNRDGDRLKAIESLMRLSSANLLEDNYTSKIANARFVEDTIGTAMAAADANAIDYDQHFMDADTSLGEQLKTVAKLIAGRSILGNQRQIFFVQVGGYDIHTNHLTAHATLMEELSKASMAFRNTLVEMDDWDKTVAFSVSDFNRTFTVNGLDADAGTDHAWGGHALVMGGPVVGGNLYGQFPVLRAGDHAESIDADPTGGRGRWIPSTAVDQYASVLASWFGVDSNSLDTIFPNLYRFDNPLTTTAPNLNFIPLQTTGPGGGS